MMFYARCSEFIYLNYLLPNYLQTDSAKFSFCVSVFSILSEFLCLFCLLKIRINVAAVDNLFLHSTQNWSIEIIHVVFFFLHFFVAVIVVGASIVFIDEKHVRRVFPDFDL